MRHIVSLVSFNRTRVVLALIAAAALATDASAQGDIVLQASQASVKAGKWRVANDGNAAGGRKMRHADGNATKRITAAARPTNYFELTFTADAGVPYHLWLHGRADGDDWDNDSVFVQFAGSVTKSGSATYRIGTTSATEVNLEECKGCGLARGWVWQDNGWGKGVLGSEIYFAKSGVQTLRVQTREDGLSIDQILLSPTTYRRRSPSGALRAPAKPTAPPAEEPDNQPDTTPDPDDEDDDGDDEEPRPSSSSSQLKVLDWNIHHGVGTDGDYDIPRLADWIARTGANVVSLNEVEKYTGWGNEDQPARFAALLKARTGKTWHYNFAQRDGNTKGQGNLLLTTYEIESDDDYELSYSRSVARIAIVVNGVRVNVYSTHLDADSSARRSTQIRELKAWADNYPEQRIVVGDFNAWSGTSEIALMTASYADAWATAKSLDLEVSYSGNAAGNTRRSRIDYAFYSKQASRLKLKKAQVFDVRDSRGVMPSDHRPLLSVFEVR
jgi:endonuclease/exonuclease/phosphatase family metal-dependent hydrolase